MCSKIKVVEMAQRNIRKICLVSSAAFSMLSYTYGWTAPIAAVLGCAADYADTSNVFSHKEQLEEAITKALDRAAQSCQSESQRRIISELIEQNIEVDDLQDLIRQTETYRAQYCTQADTKEIVSRFEMHFRECVAESPELSRLYILSTGMTTLDELKKIYEIVYEGKSKVDAIHSEALKTNKFLDGIKQKICTISHEAAYVLISMAVFLLVGIISQNGYPHHWVYAGLVSYSVSSFLTYNGRIEEYIYLNALESKKDYLGKSGSRVRISPMMSILIHPLISLAIFLIFVWSTSARGDSVIYYALAGIAAGGAIAQWIRYLHKVTLASDKIKNDMTNDE